MPTFVLRQPGRLYYKRSKTRCFPSLSRERFGVIETIYILIKAYHQIITLSRKQPADTA